MRMHSAYSVCDRWSGSMMKRDMENRERTCKYAGRWVRKRFEITGVMTMDKAIEGMAAVLSTAMPILEADSTPAEPCELD